jgi:flagellar hook-basal body complex protein FliE
VDIHDVMIAAQKSKTAFQLLMELRNKGLDLYREVLRMQI